MTTAWSGPASGIGTVGFVVTSQPPRMVDKIKQEYERLSVRYLSADGLLALPTAALLASGSV